MRGTASRPPPRLRSELLRMGRDALAWFWSACSPVVAAHQDVSGPGPSRERAGAPQPTRDRRSAGPPVRENARVGLRPR